MVDAIMNVLWPLGAVVVWYPMYVLLLDRLGSHPPDNFDRTMSIVLGLVVSFLWPFIIGAAAILVLPWFASRTLYRRFAPKRIRAVFEKEEWEETRYQEDRGRG